MPQIETAWVIQGAGEGEPHFLVVDEKGTYWSQDQSRAKRYISEKSAWDVGIRFMGENEFKPLFVAFPVTPTGSAREAGGAAGAASTGRVNP